MQRAETQSNGGKVANHGGTFTVALHSRKRKIRGLLIRNGLYRAEVRADRGSGKTMPLIIPLEAKTLDAARAELEKKRAENRQKRY